MNQLIHQVATNQGGLEGTHLQKMELSGPEGPEMNPKERRLLAWPREMLKGQYGLL